jgi:wyosine [tRNA(Phe)-imidazoG37] synthetase (radical SAM superfamily)
MVKKQQRYIFGPVPSRRLGLSLGVDIVPLKSCTLDCVYCQLGKSSNLTNERQDFVPVAEVLSQLKAKLDEGVKADYITISGSGEPTLNLSIGKIIDGIRELTKTPIAILTNGTLLFDPAVRADCAKADVVLPSLDAGDPDTFAKINRPHKAIHFDAIVEGLCQFRKEFKGQIWLEVFIVEGINTADAQLENISKIIGRIRPDKVQLNTAVRPTAERRIEAVAAQKLALIAQKIGFGAEVIADYPATHLTADRLADRDSILAMLKRRPCSIDDIFKGLNISPSEAVKHITALVGAGLVISEEKNGRLFYKAK